MLSVRFCALPEELVYPVGELCRSLEITVCEDAPITVTIREGESEGISLSGDKENVLLTYGKRNELYRAISYLPEFIREGKPIEEANRYDMLCYMADMSRNAVYSIEGAKRMIRYMASMGYNSLMLYTEDTYEIPEYRYFGHMRGRFSKAELKEIDDYAYGFGIEVIPCIQTLAHLATATRWPDFAGYIDIDDVLMVGDERTYKFVEAAISVCRDCFRSHRINLGMDEAWRIGRGTYLDKNGQVPRSDILCDHLGRVVEICKKHDVEPMIWSDMFFRVIFGGVYRVREGEIPQEIIDKVPEGLTLIYWDYYSRDRQIFEHMLDCHKKFPNPIMFAGGAWKWSGFGAHNRFSLTSTELQLNVCEEKDVGNVIVTAWGDNGAEASQFSALASMLYFAERKYRPREEVELPHLNKRAADCFGATFDELLGFDLPDMLPLCDLEHCDHPKNPCKYLLYNDCLEGLADKHLDEATAADAYRRNAQKARELSSNKNFGYAFDTIAKLCEFLSHKCDLGLRLRRAYKAGDKATLAAIAEELDTMVPIFDEFVDAFRKQWNKENKPFGLSSNELRFGGVRIRLISTAARIREYLDGEVESIPELEEEVLSYDGSAPAEGQSPYLCLHNVRGVATPGLML